MLLFEDWLKLIGKLLILISIGMQAYALSAESEIRNKQVEYQTRKDHEIFMLDLMNDKIGENIFTQPIIDKRKNQLNSIDAKWIKRSKIRLQQIKWLGLISFWTIVIFGFGTLVLLLGEYMTFRQRGFKSN